MFDPTSINYSAAILQSLLDAGAMTMSSRLPPAFDADFFVAAMAKALRSVHVQTLLKMLTFIYSILGK